ncbi:DUF6279 family lipoprotein [Porticoccaceae bacterium LTM1]|nr:DUF6279 family lipoprotein [Porticoccaceae bacterium LTM1]
MTIKRILIPLIVLTLLASCSTLKLGYNTADWWLGWYAGRYVDMNGNQKNTFKSDIDSLLSWHRTTQLPRYAEFFEDLKEAVAEPVAADQLQQAALDGQQMINDVQHRVIKPAARLLVSLSDKQVEKLLDELQEQAEKYQEDYVEPNAEERIEARTERMEKLAKQWIGKPNNYQKERIQRWSAALKNSASMEINHQQDWKKKLAQALKQRQYAPQTVNDFLESYLFRSANSVSEEHRQANIHNQQQTFQLIADLINSMTDKQREHLDKRLSRLADDFRELAEEK